MWACCPDFPSQSQTTCSTLWWGVVHRTAKSLHESPHPSAATWRSEEHLRRESTVSCLGAKAEMLRGLRDVSQAETCQVAEGRDREWPRAECSAASAPGAAVTCELPWSVLGTRRIPGHPPPPLERSASSCT